MIFFMAKLQRLIHSGKTTTANSVIMLKSYGCISTSWKRTPVSVFVVSLLSLSRREQMNLTGENQ